MTLAVNKNWLVRNGISLTTLITVLLLFFRVGAKLQHIEDRLDAYDEHRVNSVLHMPLSEKIQMFITREEFRDRQANWNIRFESIDGKLDLLLKEALTKNK